MSGSAGSTMYSYKNYQSVPHSFTFCVFVCNVMLKLIIKCDDRQYILLEVWLEHLFTIQYLHFNEFVPSFSLRVMTMELRIENSEHSKHFTLTGNYQNIFRIYSYSRRSGCRKADPSRTPKWDITWNVYLNLFTFLA